MIFNSTPSSITWGTDENHRVIFTGEWTLEPRFYVNASVPIFWESTSPRRLLTIAEREYALRNMLLDATAKGWKLVVT